MNDRLGEEVKKYMTKRTFFLSYGMSFYSIAFGSFYTTVDGYLVSRAEPALAEMPENIVGYALILAGSLLLISLVLNNLRLRKIALIMMTVLWGGLWIVTTTFAFGSGYPDADWIDKTLALSILLFVAWKGDYSKI